MYDVVDVLAELKLEFPHVEFIVEEETRGRAEYHRFKLVRLSNQKFSTPIKTAIVLKKDAIINEFQLDEIMDKMFVSFAGGVNQ